MARLRELFEGTGRSPLCVIAEAGVNHDGSADEAHRLVELAAEAGADAVKFQTFDPRALVSAAARSAPYQLARGEARTQLELLRGLVLPLEAWPELAAHAADRGLDFFTTPFDTASLDLACELGVPALKLGSGELTDEPFLREAARRGLPVICSTGMGTLAEVAASVGWLAQAPALALMHCVSSYPAPAEQANLRAITTMADTFGLPVGWSDHTVGEVTAVAAVALGASVLEKHLTSDRGRPGPDHAASADPSQLRAYVDAVRLAHAALGDGVKRPAPAEEENRPLVRRSWHALKDLPAGVVLAASDLALLRPADGLAPSVSLRGRRLALAVAAGAPVRAEDLEPPR